jgi:hypothetical protein
MACAFDASAGQRSAGTASSEERRAAAQQDAACCCRTRRTVQESRNSCSCSCVHGGKRRMSGPSLVGIAVVLK